MLIVLRFESCITAGAHRLSKAQKAVWKKPLRKSKNFLTMPTATSQLVNYLAQLKSTANVSNKFQNFSTVGTRSGWRS